MGVKETGGLGRGEGMGPGPQPRGWEVPALRGGGAVDGGLGSRAPGAALRLHLRHRGSWVLSRVECVAAAYFSFTQSTEGVQPQSYHPLAPSSPPLRPQGQKAKAQATHSGISPPVPSTGPTYTQTLIYLFCPENHPPSVSPARLGTGHSAPDVSTPSPPTPAQASAVQILPALLEHDPHHQEVNFLII